MSKITRLTAALATCLCLATTSVVAAECRAPGIPEANVTLVKGFYEAFNTMSLSRLDTVLAKDWVDVPMGAGQEPGLDGWKKMLGHYHAAFPDLHATNNDFIASGDKVVVRSTITGTQRGEFVGVKATDKSVKMQAIDIHQVCDGRIVQTWHVEDWLNGMFQLGILPPKK